jgi:hypothetical protein
MHKKYILSFGFAAAVLVASLLMINTSQKQNEKPTCCKKTQQCSGEMKSEAPAESTPENLSHQFISLPVLSH